MDLELELEDDNVNEKMVNQLLSLYKVILMLMCRLAQNIMDRVKIENIKYLPKKLINYWLDQMYLKQ